jgi:hypothetical protein
MGECDERGGGDNAACCRCNWAARISTADVPAARDAAVRFDS